MMHEHGYDKNWVGKQSLLRYHGILPSHTKHAGVLAKPWLGCHTDLHLQKAPSGHAYLSE